MAERHFLSLSELTTLGWDVQKKIESGELQTKDTDFNRAITGAIEHLTEAQRRVDELNLFSKNEEIDEICTTDLKYLLLPALLGDLIYQLMNDDRLSTVKRAHVYFTQYLHCCQDYSIMSEKIPNLITKDSKDNTVGSSIEQLSSQRQEKIARLKSQKEAERKLKDLTAMINAGNSARHVDEELVRDHTLTTLKLWIYKSIECLYTINQEMELLELTKSSSLSNVSTVNSTPPTTSKPTKPFVITKDMLKNKVFGAGYPSLPTMTVEEFYEQKYRQPLTQAQSTKHNEDDQKDQSDDDDDKLRKEREFDDYKDDHRRGWGNRKNMG